MFSFNWRYWAAEAISLGAAYIFLIHGIERDNKLTYIIGALFLGVYGAVCYWEGRAAAIKGDK